MNKNIFYLLGHKTLTDFEIEIFNFKNYGIYICKIFDNLKYHSLISNCYEYDIYIENKIHKDELDKLNKINWYSNAKINDDIINTLNNNFNIIFITLITNGELLDQLIKNFRGKIYYRLFGREKNYRYDSLLTYKSDKIKYIFSYKEILDFEMLHDNFFNYDNSYIINLGLPTNFIKKYTDTYNPTNNDICFICSKINICPYYTEIYNSFIDKFKKYQYKKEKNTISKESNYAL